MIVNMKEFTEKQLKKMIESWINDSSSDKLEEYLAERGVIVPPVKIGQTVYCALPPLDEGDEPEIVEYEVKGILVSASGHICVIDDCNEPYVLGSSWCCLTREEAAEHLKILIKGE